MLSKRWLVCGLIFALLFLIISTIQAQNLVFNSSFEQEKIGWLRPSADRIQRKLFMTDNKAAINGTKSLLCLPAEQLSTERQSNIVLDCNKEYTLSAYFRTNGFESGRYSGLFIINDGWHSTNNSRIKPSEGTTDWKRYSRTFRPRPSKDGKYQVIICSPAKGKMWVDAIQLEEGTNASEYQEPLSSNTLNNIVRELVNIDFSRPREGDYLIKPYKKISFEKQRDGWIYIEVSAKLKKSDNVLVTLDEATVLAIDRENLDNTPPETMRFVKAGTHQIKVWISGRPELKNITVRSIPEIIFFKVFFKDKKTIRAVKRRGSAIMRGWDYLKRQEIWNNYNVVVSVIEIEPYAPYITEWRKKGGKWFIKGSLLGTKTTGTRGPYQWENIMENSLVDGIIIDEFSIRAEDRKQYLFWADRITKVGKNPRCRDKTLYGFTGGYSSFKKPLLDPIFESGFGIATERYLSEREDENKADRFLEKYLVKDMQKWSKNFPGSERSMVCFLAPDDNIPVMSFDRFPHVNFKVYLEKQFNLIANHPAFENLYGVGFWTAYNMSEEILQWYTKLVRHYLIEGNKYTLSKDPYILTHLDNPGFEREEKGWSFVPASKDTIKIIDVKQLRFKNRKRHVAIPEGTKVLYTKRVKQKPNIISQKIKNLSPTRLYSLKVYNADFENFEARKRISISIQLVGVEVLDKKSSDEVFLYDTINNRKGEPVRICWNRHYRVFRAKTSSGELILSDWKSSIDAGGPENQEIIWDFIELQPYFEAEN